MLKEIGIAEHRNNHVNAIKVAKQFPQFEARRKKILSMKKIMVTNITVPQNRKNVKIETPQDIDSCLS